MNLIFLGPPGAGKGTLAVQVKEAYRIPHISTGDLFRDAIKNQTPLGKKVKAILDSGELVPDEVTIAMVEERLGQNDVDGGFILDGFPRTIPQAEALEKLAKIEKVINLEVDGDIVIKRLSGRRIAKGSGKVYHVLFNPTKKEGECDVSGEPLIQRPDDTEEAVKNRLKVYKRQTAPLIEHYREKGLLVTIDANPEPEAVFRNLKAILDR